MDIVKQKVSTFMLISKTDKNDFTYHSNGCPGCMRKAIAFLYQHNKEFKLIIDESLELIKTKMN